MGSETYEPLLISMTMIIKPQVNCVYSPLHQDSRGPKLQFHFQMRTRFDLEIHPLVQNNRSPIVHQVPLTISPSLNRSSSSEPAGENVMGRLIRIEAIRGVASRGISASKRFEE